MKGVGVLPSKAPRTAGVASLMANHPSEISSSSAVRHLLDLGDDAVLCLAEVLLRDGEQGTLATIRLCSTCRCVPRP